MDNFETIFGKLSVNLESNLRQLGDNLEITLNQLSDNNESTLRQPRDNFWTTFGHLKNILVQFLTTIFGQSRVNFGTT